MSNLINKIKTEQKNNIRHGEIQTKLPNFHYFDVDSLVCTNSPSNKTYEYYNTDVKKMDTITFLDYKKWYKENEAVWNSIDYGNAQFKLQYQDKNNACLYIQRREVPSSFKPKLKLILERMNKIFTKNGNRINESTDWIHYFYNPSNGWSGSQNLDNYSGVYWSHVKNLLLEDSIVVKEEAYKKRAYTVYSKEKKFTGVEEKDPFLVYDDEKYQGITVHKKGGVKYYVSEDLYLNRDKNFLKNLTTATYVKRDTDTEFPNHYPIGMQRNFYERYVYEVLNHNTTAGMQPTKKDFVLPMRRRKPSTNTYSHFHFENEKYYCKNSTWSDELKKLIFTEGRRIVLYGCNK